jgi:GNAT superfamily N-acetyltransferase
MNIVSAKPNDAAMLTAIAISAKRHWGYPDDWIRRWNDQLTITPEYIANNPTFVALLAGQPIGFGALQIRGAEAVLDHLWVLPRGMGCGIGRALFVHAERIAREQSATRLTIVGDPHAEGFYQRLGAVVEGREPAFMDGVERYLPLRAKVL